MKLVQNIPFFCMMLSMFSGIVSSVLPVKWARRLNTAMILIVGIMSGWLLYFMANSGIGSYTYMMGHFPAPWGNELRVGVLEAGMALFFSIIMLLSLLGGRKKLHQEVESTKHNIYYILCNLLLSIFLFIIEIFNIFLMRLTTLNNIQLMRSSFKILELFLYCKNIFQTQNFI